MYKLISLFLWLNSRLKANQGFSLKWLNQVIKSGFRPNQRGKVVKEVTRLIKRIFLDDFKRSENVEKF